MSPGCGAQAAGGSQTNAGSNRHQFCSNNYVVSGARRSGLENRSRQGSCKMSSSDRRRRNSRPSRRCGNVRRSPDMSRHRVNRSKTYRACSN